MESEPSGVHIWKGTGPGRRFSSILDITHIWELSKGLYDHGSIEVVISGGSEAGT